MWEIKSPPSTGFDRSDSGSVRRIFSGQDFGKINLQCGTMNSQKMTVAELHKELRSRDAEILTLKLEIDARNTELAALRASSSWRITAPYRVIGGTLSALLIFIKRPKFGAVIILRGFARRIRANPKIRSAAHRVFRKLPEQVRQKLVMLAPPTAEEIGHILSGRNHFRSEFLGEAAWIYDRLRRNDADIN